jgi:hypothetical protein
MRCNIAHRLLATNSRVLHENTQACKPGYTVQGMYCGECEGTADPAVKLLAAPLGTFLILFVFGSWCFRPYFTKTEAKIRRMAFEQGTRLTSRISKRFGTFRDKLATDVQMQVRSTTPHQRRLPLPSRQPDGTRAPALLCASSVR